MLRLAGASSNKSSGPYRVFCQLSKTSATESVDRTETPTVKRLQDYKPPLFLVDDVKLNFVLDPSNTTVSTQLQVRFNTEAYSPCSEVDLLLDGDKDMLTLVPSSLRVEGRVLENGKDYKLDKNILTIRNMDGTGRPITIQFQVLIDPSKNKALMAEGFRRITFFPDRPDVMSIYEVTIVAERQASPVLLSNGNCIDTGLCEDTRYHYAVYKDPFRKPSYLFALVAGKLVALEDSFVTMSGRKVRLFIYVQEGNILKAKHAMQCLKRAMKWDEENYGREYDLDIFNIVAVDDFSMGAMENKSLNIFNSKYVLANPKTATDADFDAVEAVVAHEYFHNWTGNRVTLRDWFQLSLKEGLTVFREQEFSADMTNRAVKRISDVMRLRASQFPQDAGPMAHPVRPESYIEINNFYTVTVYEKGAEVIRMLRNLLGPDGFRKGCDLYFERYDGKAVTCDDWLKAHQDANPHVNLEQFKLWYSQAGTPNVTSSSQYEETASTLHLYLEQHIPQTPGQFKKEPMQIPVKIGIIDEYGNAVTVDMGDGMANETKVLELKDRHQKFSFYNVPPNSRLSLFRGFSSPVKFSWKDGEKTEDLAFMMVHDKDEFNRWDSAQSLGLKTILETSKQIVDSHSTLSQDSIDHLSPLSSCIVEAFQKVLFDERLDPRFRSTMFTLPSELFIGEWMKPVVPDAIHLARQHLKKELSRELSSKFWFIFEKLEKELEGPYCEDAEHKGKRALKNICLEYLCCRGDNYSLKRCLQHFRNADNMTDSLATLNILANYGSEEGELALAEFYRQWEHEFLVLDKWFRVQSGVSRKETLHRVRSLVEHKSFDIYNPNNVYSLIGGYALQNPYAFHLKDGSGYRFVADQIIRLDGINPQVAARIASAFTQWQNWRVTCKH
eukprot:jgi/Galph1/1645/GphlegSOOS_G305.1